jgi:hypothetical protein
MSVESSYDLNVSSAVSRRQQDIAKHADVLQVFELELHLGGALLISQQRYLIHTLLGSTPIPTPPQTRQGPGLLNHPSLDSGLHGLLWGSSSRQTSL